jgi:hypothetical protein
LHHNNQLYQYEKYNNKKLKDICPNKEQEYIYQDIYPSSCEKVNYKLFTNKDGQYAWRLFQLIHPVLYVDLVHLPKE